MMPDVRHDRARAELLVGRDAEVDALVGYAADPATRLVLVPGEAGVGKTRLLTEAVARWEQDGWRCLVGHCLDLGEGSMPYLPFAEIARSAGATPWGGDVAVDRGAVADGVRAMLDDLAAETPLAVVVEDVHWADASTRDLLSVLLATQPTGRVLLVASYRSDEMHRQHPLRAQVAEWVRRPGVQRLTLEPLPSGAVRRMVAELVEQPPTPDAVDRIVERAQGNAFYVEELVAALAGGEEDLPDDLAQLLLVRLDRLGEPARRLVRVAAVAGQRVPHDLLAAVAPDPDGLDAALREALDAHVLVRSGESEYAFRHALLGEAAYDDLLPGERTRLHTAYAAAVRELRGSHGAPELARHALASHDLSTALLASVEAAALALAAGGPEEAAGHLRTALDLHPRVGPTTDDAPPEEDLVLRAVEALVAAGRPERAAALAGQHVAATDDREPRRRAVLLLAHLDAMRATEAVAHPVEVSAEALALLGPEPTPLRARVLAAHALALSWEDRHAEVLPIAEEALALAEELGLPHVAADARLSLTWVQQRLGRGDTAEAEVRRIVEQARADGDVHAEGRGLTRLGFVAAEAGRLKEAQQLFSDSARVGRASGRPWSTMAVVGRMVGGLMAFQRGEWDEALALVDHRDEDPPPTPRALLDSVAMVVRAARGDAGALELLPAVRDRWRDDGLTGTWSSHATIQLRGSLEGADAAMAAYDDVVRVYRPLWGDRFDALVRLGALALAALADAARRAPSADRAALRTAADRVVADVARVREGWVADAWTPGIEARAWAARVDAERLRLDWQLGDEVDLPALESAWRESTALFDELGWLEEAARSRARLGAVLRAAGRGEEAQHETRAAREQAVRLGAAPLLEEVGERSPSAQLLTPREHEILALVADGRSNAEIGTRLFISAKTVSVHVSNLMAKLGAGSRTEAVALARRAGLLGA